MLDTTLRLNEPREIRDVMFSFKLPQTAMPFYGWSEEHFDVFCTAVDYRAILNV